MGYLLSKYKQNRISKLHFIITAFIIVFLSYSCKSEEKNYPEIKKNTIKKKKKSKKINTLRKPIEPNPNFLIKAKNHIFKVSSYDSINNKISTGIGIGVHTKNKYGVLTNRHLVAGSFRVEVVRDNIVFHVHNIIGVDTKKNLVLLSIPKSYGLNNSFEHYDRNPAIGNSIYFLSKSMDEKITVSQGYIPRSKKTEYFGKIFQVTPAPDSSSNGSPVFDKYNIIIGILSSREMDGKKTTFLIPYPKVREIYLIDKTRITELNKFDFNYFSNLETSNEKAEYMVSNREYIQAISYLKKAIEEDPEDKNILINLGISYRETGNGEKSINIFNDLINRNDNIIQAHFELGLTFIKLEMYKKALNMLEFVYNKEPDYEDLDFHFGITLYKMMAYKKSAYHLELATENSFNPETYYLLGMAYAGMNKFNKAVKAMRNALNMEQFNIKYIVKLGELYYEAGNFRYSVEILLKGLKFEPDNNDIHLFLGLCYLAYNDLEKAEKEYKFLKEYNRYMSQSIKLAAKIRNYKHEHKIY